MGKESVIYSIVLCY